VDGKLLSTRFEAKPGPERSENELPVCPYPVTAAAGQIGNHTRETPETRILRINGVSLPACCPPDAANSVGATLLPDRGSVDHDHPARQQAADKPLSFAYFAIQCARQISGGDHDVVQRVLAVSELVRSVARTTPVVRRITSSLSTSGAKNTH
jgi:hypothetical protein